MEKKNFLVLILAIVLVVVLVAAINFFVKKYENESMPATAPIAVQHRVLAPANVQEPAPDEGQVSPQGGDSQFSTENGRLLR
jgi:hypothetical protein